MAGRGQGVEVAVTVRHDGGKLAFRLYNSGVDYKQVWFTGGDAALCRDGMIHYFRAMRRTRLAYRTCPAAELKFEADLFRDAGL